MIKFEEKYLKNFVDEFEIQSFEKKLKLAHNKLNEKENCGQDYKGWLELPEKTTKKEILKILEIASEIKKKCDVLVVIGIGGSYLGTKAAVEFLKPQYLNSFPSSEIIFAGNNLSSFEIFKLKKIFNEKDVCLNVVSKSGTTLEPAISFRILRKMLEEKYGKEESRERIICTTGFENSLVKEIAEKNRYKILEIPKNIGGRYSVLTNVSLFPLAVAGINIEKILFGAKKAYQKFKKFSLKNKCYRYAVIRNILYSKGKSVELIAGYEPYFKYFFEWWKQLFGESEGKCEKGIFPASAIFSSDLHSLGQFIQEGSKILFETVLTVKNDRFNILIPQDKENIDKINYLSEKSLKYVNDKAFEGTILAHFQGEIPNFHIEIDCADEFNLGFLIYFFEKACAISAYILGVDPFNQPGVEAYKKNMFLLLGR